LVARFLETASDEKKIVWIVYLFAAILAGQIDALSPRMRSGSLDDCASDSEKMATRQMGREVSPEYLTVGLMVTRIVELMKRTDQQSASRVSEELEFSYLYFLDQFKKLYLSEQTKITSLVTPRSEGISKLCYAIGVQSDNEVIDIFVRKIFGNLQNRQSMESVIKKTLGFANDFIKGTSAIYIDDVKSASTTVASALMRNERMQYILQHHENIDFGRIDKNFNTVYYSILFSMLFSDRKTMVDWTYFNSLFSKISQNGIQTKSAEQGKLIVTLARNLKGVSLAATSSDEYKVLFKYLVDNPKNIAQCKITLFSAAADVWWDEPQVVVPVLKFIADFAHNRSSRISFDENSPNGVVLFREAVKVLSAYGQRMLQRPASFQYRDIYEDKYKGIGAALALFTNTLGGGYANLGVFELYGDCSLSVSMSTALGLCLSIPLSDLSAFLKSLKSVYTFLEIATKSHMSALLKLGPAQVSTLLRALEDGLTSFDTAISLSCCTAIDNICTYLVDTKEGADEVSTIQSTVSHQEVRAGFARLLALLNHLSVSGEFASTWSLSRPFLALLLLAKTEFIQLETSMIQQQTNPERRQLVKSAYTDLMNGISEDLTTKNRELFTKNLYQFGINLRNK
jgi:exportin-7